MEAPSLPRWLDNYPGLASVVHPVAQLLRDAVEHDDAEFELRLMRTLPSWTANTGEAYVDFVTMCSDSCTANGLMFGEWAEHTDFCFSADGRDMRSRVVYDGESYNVRTTTTTKEPIGRVDLLVTESPWGVRVDARREVVIPPEFVPVAVLPSRVAMNTRCSAYWPPAQPAWRYDITLQYSGDSRMAAESSQRNSEVAPVVVIELEFVGTAEYVRERGAVCVAVSGLIKLLDIVGCRTSECSVRSAPRRA